MNDLYETREFLSNVMLIGFDGGAAVYGIDIKGRYIEVPFIEWSESASALVM